MSSSVEFDFYVQSAALEAVITGGAVLLSEGVGVTLVKPGDIHVIWWQ